MTVRARWTTMLAGLVLAVAGPSAQARTPAADRSGTLDRPSPALRRFLRQTFEGCETWNHRPCRAHVATVQLARRRTELVLVQFNQGPCGSGGCSFFTFESAPGGGAPFRERGYSPITFAPARLLPTVHHGLPDLTVLMKAGPKSTQPYYDAVLPFNGRRYPWDPQVPPARHATAREVRRALTLIPAEDESGLLIPP